MTMGGIGDCLYGGSGNDTYIIRPFYNTDTIIYSDPQGFDTVVIQDLDNWNRTITDNDMVLRYDYYYDPEYIELRYLLPYVTIVDYENIESIISD